MNFALAIGEVIKTFFIFLNPDRREKAVLRGAIEAGDQLLQILRRQGRYKEMDEAKRKRLETHYQKRWDSWKDGK